MSADILLAVRDKDENRSFQSTLWLSSAEESTGLKAPVFIFISHSYKDIYRHVSGRSHTLLSFGTIF